MKIVAKSNFDIESVAEWLVAENIQNTEYAAIMCRALNAKYSGCDATYFYYVQPDDYVLWRGMADLVGE